MSGLDIVYPTKTILEECEQSVPAPAPSFKECDFILQTTGVTRIYAPNTQNELRL